MPSASADRRQAPRARAARVGLTFLLAVLLVGALWLSGCMERLFYQPTREATPAPRWLHPEAQAVWFESGDGTRLRGWFVPAMGTDRAATVVHVHGNAGSMASHIFFVEHLPAAGFNVFLFDYRGYGESEGSPTGRAALLEDTRAALRAVRTLPGVDPSRLALVGQSLGGAFAILAMAEDPEIRAAVLESPFASWRDVAASAVGGDPPPWWARGLAAALIKDGGPRPIDAIASIDRPILILHGEADRIVPPSHGRRLTEAAPKAELLLFPGGDHNTLQETHPEARRAMVEFLRRTTAAPSS